MKRLINVVLSALLLAPLPFSFAVGQEMEDMRLHHVAARESLERLKARAAAELETARLEAARSRAIIAEDKEALVGETERMEARVAALENQVTELAAAVEKLEAEEADLIARLAESDSVVNELVGVVRIHAKDLQSIIASSLQSALNLEDIGFLEGIAANSNFPGVADIVRMNDTVFTQMKNSGIVRVTRGPIVNRAGNTAEADILVLGNFTAAYRLGEEVGFLTYSPTGRKLFALSRLPSASQRKELLAYMEGRAEAVPIDISRGGALGQMIRTPTLWEQIHSGGLLVWPIVAMLAIAMLIVVERTVFLVRNRLDGDGFAGKIEDLAARGDWRACEAACAGMADKPLARVIGAGLANAHTSSAAQRETMENALQEAILKEIPPLERFLSTLGMLAAIAPLLGLLGTVTGMIDTFHVITQFGTGDPRMMSGGISVALVTTMMGLTVAIPIMLVHTLLNRTVDIRIAELEEKAVALINIADRHRHAAV